MRYDCEFAVGFLDVEFRGVRLHAESVVVRRVDHHGCCCRWLWKGEIEDTIGWWSIWTRVAL